MEVCKLTLKVIENIKTCDYCLYLTLLKDLFVINSFVYPYLHNEIISESEDFKLEKLNIIYHIINYDCRIGSKYITIITKYLNIEKLLPLSYIRSIF